MTRSRDKILRQFERLSANLSSLELKLSLALRKIQQTRTLPSENLANAILSLRGEFESARARVLSIGDGLQLDVTALEDIQSIDGIQSLYAQVLDGVHTHRSGLANLIERLAASTTLDGQPAAEVMQAASHMLRRLATVDDDDDPNSALVEISADSRPLVALQTLIEHHASADDETFGDAMRLVAKTFGSTFAAGAIRGRVTYTGAIDPLSPEVIEEDASVLPVEELPEAKVVESDVESMDMDLDDHDILEEAELFDSDERTQVEVSPLQSPEPFPTARAQVEGEAFGVIIDTEMVAAETGESPTAAGSAEVDFDDLQAELEADLAHEGTSPGARALTQEAISDETERSTERLADAEDDGLPVDADDANAEHASPPAAPVAAVALASSLDDEMFSLDFDEESAVRPPETVMPIGDGPEEALVDEVESEIDHVPTRNLRLGDDGKLAPLFDGVPSEDDADGIGVDAEEPSADARVSEPEGDEISLEVVAEDAVDADAEAVPDAAQSGPPALPDGALEPPDALDEALAVPDELDRADEPAEEKASATPEPDADADAEGAEPELAADGDVDDAELELAADDAEPELAADGDVDDAELELAADDAEPELAADGDDADAELELAADADLDDAEPELAADADLDDAEPELVADADLDDAELELAADADLDDAELELAADGDLASDADPDHAPDLPPTPSGELLDLGDDALSASDEPEAADEPLELAVDDDEELADEAPDSGTGLPAVAGDEALLAELGLDDGELDDADQPVALADGADQSAPDDHAQQPAGDGAAPDSGPQEPRSALDQMLDAAAAARAAEGPGEEEDDDIDFHASLKARSAVKAAALQQEGSPATPPAGEAEDPKKTKAKKGFYPVSEGSNGDGKLGDPAGMGDGSD